MEPSNHEIVVWVDEVAVSIGQIQKSYDWSIAQWATLGNAILTAVFVLIATGLVETYKKTLQLPHFWSWVAGIAMLYLASYAFCRFRIERLRREFLELYTLLQELT
jgi:hypothetical protein